MMYTKDGCVPIPLIEGLTHDEMLAQGYVIVSEIPNISEDFVIEEGCVLNWCSQDGCWKNFAATAEPVYIVNPPEI